MTLPQAQDRFHEVNPEWNLTRAQGWGDCGYIAMINLLRQAGQQSPTNPSEFRAILQAPEGWAAAPSIQAAATLFTVCWRIYYVSAWDPIVRFE